MYIQAVDPFSYPEWNERVLAAPQASIFHTTHWLRVLQESYGYRPYYFAAFQGQQLTVLLPVMEVKSWLTGVRGVSLPFADYCEPLVDESMDPGTLLTQVSMTAQQRKWQFLEVRGGDAMFRGVSPSTVYYRHRLVLHGNAEKIFARFRSNYRTKIRKAGENSLSVDILRSPDAMAAYYRLHCLTRKRLGLVPQPAFFFRKIQEHLIANNCGWVMLVSHQGRPVAGAIFFSFGSRALYKFGASDVQSQHLYPNYLLFWHAMQWLCQHNYTEICFGRTAPGNQGLLQFKDGWGASKYRLNYYKYDLKTVSFVQHPQPAVESGYHLWKHLPVPLLQLVGSVLYKHLG